MHAENDKKRRLDNKIYCVCVNELAGISIPTFAVLSIDKLWMKIEIIKNKIRFFQNGN